MNILLTILIIITVILLLTVFRLKVRLSKATNDAERDPLTGAYNRAGFIAETERILRASAENNEFAILFLNIKGFKAINEIFGFAAGDEILKESISILEDSSFKPLLIGRFEADRFVSLVRQKNIDYDELTELCQRIYVRDGKKFDFYGRCGVYLVDDNSRNVSGMCDRAKLAEDFIEDDYVKPYAVYDQSMRDGLVTEKELTSELHRSLDAKEFEVYYQPVYGLASGRIESAEALVRWNHPKRGLLSPGVFIPIFEENGYISELDRYVGSVTREFARHRINDGRNMVPIATNMSRMDFYDTEMIDGLYNTLLNKALPPGFARIEITESAYCYVTENNSRIMSDLREKGAVILLDDFGSGYSSLSSICDFDLDIIKLDLEFIRLLETKEKVKPVIIGIIDMAHHVGARVIAEGVETQAQADFLRAAGCDMVQGYLYARPMRRPDFEKLLDNMDNGLKEAK